MRRVPNRVVLGLMLAMVGAWAGRAWGGGELKRSRTFAFVGSPRELTALRPEQLSGRFNGFVPVPGAGGLRFLVLPFQAAGDPNEAAELEALAFSFVLSFALDWHPRNATSMHAYFTFKRDPEGMRQAGRTLEPWAVRKAMKRFDATHAIGGRVRRLGDSQYAVEFRMFGPDASLMHSATTGTNTFFDVVGEAAISALAALDYPVPPALAKHLRQPRCAAPESLGDLGRAAFAEERSDAEFALYEAIVKRDPGFGEVHFWWNNQNFWRNNAKDTSDEGDRRSLRAYLIPPAYEGIHWGRTETAREEEDGWRRKMTELVGKQHPLIVEQRMNRPVSMVNPSFADAIPDAIQVLRENPDNYRLAVLTIRQLVLHADYAMSASLAQVALRSPSVPSRYVREELTFNTAMGHYGSGYHYPAWGYYSGLYQDSLRRRDREGTERNGLVVFRCMAQMGHYGPAALLGVQMIRDGLGVDHTAFASIVGTSAILADRRDLLQELETLNAFSNYRDHYVTNHWEVMKHFEALAWRRDLRDLPVLSPELLQGSSDGMNMLSKGLRGLAIQEDSRLRRGRGIESELVDHFRWNPNFRAGWIELDALDRVNPGQVPLVAFYEVIHWLHRDDPWVVRAYADYVTRRETKGKYATPDEKRIEQGYARLPLVPWPVNLDAAVKAWENSPDKAWLDGLPIFAGEWLIKRQLERRDYQAARMTALRQLTASIGTWSHVASQMHHDILHLVDEAERLDCGSDLPCLRAP